MGSRGFLIRFIDIGLIVLFGFIMISDIEHSSLVELASAAETEENDEQTMERAFVSVLIAPTGVYTVEATPSGDILGEGLRNAAELEGVLRRVKDEWSGAARDIIVLINPDEDSTVQHTVDAMDVCDRLALKKSLQTDFGLPGSGA